ncbi:MAG: DUF4159 domain-containing protein [Pseudomonadota bacterium]
MHISSRWLSAGSLAAFTLAVLGASSSSAPDYGEPQPFREYPSFEGADAEAPLPDDWQVPGELVVGRLMYPSAGVRRGFFGSRYDWHEGGTGWTDDYPRGDRALIQMIKRNTRIKVRSVEQPVSLDDGDDIYYWPFLVAGMAQSWQLSDKQAATLREYLLRGGFLFCDSFFGEANWDSYEESLKRVFPDREIRNLTDDEVVFHVAFDLHEMTKVSVPHISQVSGGGFGMGGPPHWRGVFDDSGRLMVLIAHNNDVGDGWQFADDPRYPADESNRALRIGSNVAVYALTH